MKKLILFGLLSFFCQGAFCTDVLPITDQQIYRSVELLSKYIQQKDSNFNAGATYRELLEAIDQRGLERGLISPVRQLMTWEADPHRRQQLDDILYFRENRGEVIEMEHGAPKERDISIVSNSDNQCVGQCIRDIISTAGGGATAGGAVLGPWGAVGGAVVGGALGGVACSTSPHCSDKEKEKQKLSRSDVVEQGREAKTDWGDYFKNRRNRLVNPGIVKWKGR